MRSEKKQSVDKTKISSVSVLRNLSLPEKFVPMKPEEEAEIWEKFCETKETALRDKLFYQYWNTTISRANEFSHKMGIEGNSREDIKSAALTEMIIRLDEYQPMNDSKAKFMTYAYDFIRSACYKEGNYKTYSKEKKLNEWTNCLKEQGKALTDDNLAAISEKKKKTIQGYRQLVQITNPVYLTTPIGGEHEGTLEEVIASMEPAIDSNYEEQEQLQEWQAPFTETEQKALRWIMQDSAGIVKPEELVERFPDIGSPAKAEMFLNQIAVHYLKNKEKNHRIEDSQYLERLHKMEAHYLASYGDSTQYLIKGMMREELSPETLFELTETALPTTFLERLINTLNTIGVCKEGEVLFFETPKDVASLISDPQLRKSFNRWHTPDSGRLPSNPSENIRIENRDSFYRFCQALELNIHQVDILARKVWFMPAFSAHDSLSVACSFYLRNGDVNWYDKAKKLIERLQLTERQTLSGEETARIFEYVNSFSSEAELETWLIQKAGCFHPGEWQKQAKMYLEEAMFGQSQLSVRNLIEQEIREVSETSLLSSENFPYELFFVRKGKENRKPVTAGDLFQAICFLPKGFGIKTLKADILPTELIHAYPDGGMYTELFDDRKICGNDIQRRNLRNMILLTDFYRSFFDEPAVFYHDRDGDAAKERLSEKQAKTQQRQYLVNMNEVLHNFSLAEIYPYYPLDHLLLHCSLYRDPIGALRRFFYKAYQKEKQ